MRLLKLGGTLAAAKLADDAVDGVIGATKARYVAIAVSAALIIFQKGGEAKLHKGDTIEVEPGRDTLWKLDDPLPYRAVRIERSVAIGIPGTLR